MEQIHNLYLKGETLYNDVRTPINNFIKEERTKLFALELDAEKYSKQTNSYYYDVYNSQHKSVGFAVPK